MLKITESRLVKSQFPETQVDPSFKEEGVSGNFLMTDKSMQGRIQEFIASSKSKETFRNQIQVYKNDRKKLKKIRSRVNKEGVERRSFQEIHGIMSLIKTADRVMTMVQKLLENIKQYEVQGVGIPGRRAASLIPENKTSRLVNQIGEFHRIINTLEAQTTQIGLVGSSLSYLRHSEYENSLDNSAQIDSMVPPSNEYPISIENSERNQVSTLCSEILSRASSVNAEAKEGSKQSRRMRKKVQGEFLKIDSKKRRPLQKLEGLAFGGQMKSPKHRAKKTKTKLYSKNKL